MTLLCQWSDASLGDRDLLWWVEIGETTPPLTVDTAYDVAFERAHRVTLRLALSDAFCDVDFRVRTVLELAQGDSVNDGIELPVAVAVQAVADALQRN